MTTESGRFAEMSLNESIAAAPDSIPVHGFEKPKAVERSYRPDIDGLRAIAILSVVLYHAGLRFVSGGFTGVDIFFAISGYLIGGHIFSELRGGTFSYLRFYQHRAKRILPVFLCVISATIVLALFLLSPYEAQHLGRAAFASILSVSNILFWKTSGYFDPKSEFNPLLMTWLLGVEEQFYLVVPVLMVCIGRIRRSLLLVAIAAISAVSLAYAVLALRSQPEMVFYTLPPRAWELGLGVLLALAQQEGKLLPVDAFVAESAGAIGLGMIFVPMFLLTSRTPFPGAAALPLVLGTAILLAVPKSWVNRQLLSSSALTFFGKISFSLYLWHWPMLALAQVVYGRKKLPPAMAAGVLGISFGLSIFSYYFIEQPFRKSRRPPAPLLKRYGLSMACLLALCGVVWLSHGLRGRNPELARLEDGGIVRHRDSCVVLYGFDSPDLSPPCYPVSGDRESVALWGDSHSAALSPAVRTAANDAGMGFAQFTKPSCPPLDGATRYLPAHDAVAAECLAYNRKVLSLIDANRSISVVVLAAFWAAPLQRDDEDGWLAVNLADERRVPSLAETELEFKNALSATVRSLHAAGKRVVILGDVPSFEESPLWRISTARIPARQTLYRLMTGEQLQDSGLARPTRLSLDPEPRLLLQQAVGELPGVSMIDLLPALCPGEEQCLYREGNAMLYIDSQHLSAAGAHFALERANFSLRAEAQKQKE